MAWAKGQSGNPAGKASKGTTEARAALRENILKQMPAVVRKLLAQAKAGDVQAARTLLERVLPAVKAEALPVVLPAVAAAATATEQAALIVKAVASGELAPDVAGQLLSGIGQAVRIHEVDELERRIQELEGRVPR